MADIHDIIEGAIPTDNATEAACILLLIEQLQEDYLFRDDAGYGENAPPTFPDGHKARSLTYHHLVHGRADDAQEQLPENRAMTAQFNSNDKIILRFARLTGCATPRDAALKAFRCRDYSLLTRIAGLERLDWDKEMTDEFAMHGDYDAASQVQQFAFDTVCSGTTDHHILFEWDETTCEFARTGGKPQHIAFLEWAHSLPVEQQPCKGVCNHE
jgi:hypothetical protein